MLAVVLVVSGLLLLAALAVGLVLLRQRDEARADAAEWKRVAAWWRAGTPRRARRESRKLLGDLDA
jgi:hypothetical protein